MDLPSYLAELDRVSAAVGGIDARPSGIEPLRQSLPQTWTVRVAGQRFEVPTGWLDSALDTLEKNPTVRASLQKDVQDRLEILRQQAEALARPEAGPRPEEARATLDSILARSEFGAVRGLNWWDRARARFWAWFWQILRKLFGGLAGSPKARRMVAWGVIAVAFIVLALWVQRTLLRAARAKELEISEVLPLGKTWRDWARLALTAAAQHDYRHAMHAAYWAGVFRLADLGAWQLDRARTPREYLRLAQQARAKSEPALGEPVRPAVSPEQAQALAALTHRMESAWYGYQPATAADFLEALSQLEILGCQFPSNLATASS